MKGLIRFLTATTPAVAILGSALALRSTPVAAEQCSDAPVAVGIHANTIERGTRGAMRYWSDCVARQRRYGRAWSNLSLTHRAEFECIPLNI